MDLVSTVADQLIDAEKGSIEKKGPWTKQNPLQPRPSLQEFDAK